MALQSSGAISFSQLQAEFGGGNPIHMSEYYRGGSYVPSTKSTTTNVREPSSGYYYSTDPAWYFGAAQHTSESKAIWNGTSMATGPLNATSLTSGGKTYYRGSLVSQTPVGPTGLYVKYYKIHRTYTKTTSTSVNTGIPSSGTISMNQFYGGTN